MKTKREPNVPQTERKHPEQLERDLDPDRMADHDAAEPSPGLDPNVRPAAQVKEIVTALPEFTVEELQEIPILPEGERLQHGATYVNLRGIERRPFTATGDQIASPGAWIVPKKATPRPYWNRLVGGEEPQRQS